MIPNFTLGSRTISAYLVCVMVGIFTAGIFCVKKVDNEDRLEFLVILLWSSLGTLIGGHLLFALTNLHNIIQNIIEGRKLLEILQYFSGNVFYGGLIGGIISARLYCFYKRIDIRKYIDVSAMFIPLFHFFGRIGCFLSGCCYGIECDVGVIYRYSLIESANNIRRFPIQLVEAFGNMLLFFILYRAWKHKILEKQLLSLYFILYSVMRFIIEFFRGDSYRGFVYLLSTSQIISILVFLYAITSMIIYCKKKIK